MAAISIMFALLVAALLAIYVFVAEPLFVNPLKRVPGPRLFALTKWRLAYEDWKGTRTRRILSLHEQYGPVVRIGPEEVSFNSLSALRTIYGPGSQFGRTSFYRMFDVYGEQNLFTLHSPREHAARKKLLSHFYSKSVVLSDPGSVEKSVVDYMRLIEGEPDGISNAFNTLHYFSLDNITAFVYGQYGTTSAMNGSAAHRALIDDILHSSRRRLSWSIVHFPRATRWLYSRTGATGSLVKPLLPMQKPSTYTGIRKFALQAFQDFRATKDGKIQGDSADVSIISRLWVHHETQKPGGLTDMQLASECADHLLAGIDTTSDTLMFLVWSLSLPENKRFQERLHQEVSNIPDTSLNEHGYPKADVSDKCPYLNAVIKETLRLYAPLPSSEPRSLSSSSIIDGYIIPADTVISMSPYVMHRNPDVFENTSEFNPDRWLAPDSNELNRWFWGFSSGGRMCIGMHLAMAEMTTLVAALYREYQTSIAPGFENATPVITARVETFFDERFPKKQVRVFE